MENRSLGAPLRERTRLPHYSFSTVISFSEEREKKSHFIYLQMSVKSTPAIMQITTPLTTWPATCATSDDVRAQPQPGKTHNILQLLQTSDLKDSQNTAIPLHIVRSSNRGDL